LQRAGGESAGRETVVSSYEPGTSTLLRLLNASWPLFRAFDVRVRIHWSTALVPLFMYGGFSRWLDTGDALLWTAVWFVATYFVIWTHEMGHIWAARSVGVQSWSVTLWPLGGLAHLTQNAPSPKSEVFIALAGPFTHTIWFVLAGAPWFFLVQGTPAEGELWAVMLKGFIGLNASLLFFNLLPFWPMDGGRTMRALLAMRVHANHASLLAAYVGFAGAVVLGIVGIAMMVEGGSSQLLSDVGGPLLLGIGISNFSACRVLLLEARWGDGPYETAEAWKASIPQASWSVGDGADAEPVTVERRRPAAEKRARTAAEPARRREAARPAARPLQERIDELLDRINEVGGIENLSDAERKELAEASDRLRRGDRK
jgi:Zn-dependent protease